MSLIQMSLRLFIISLGMTLGACHSSNQPPRNHHDFLGPSEGRLDLATSNLKTLNFDDWNENTSLKEKAKVLLSPHHLTNPTIYENDRFIKMLYDFQKDVLKQINSPYFINELRPYYQTLLLENCSLLHKKSGCNIQNGLLKDPQSFEVISFLLNNALLSKPSNFKHIHKLFVLSFRLQKPKVNTSPLGTITLEHLPRLREAFQKTDPQNIHQFDKAVDLIFTELSTQTPNPKNLKNLIDKYQIEDLNHGLPDSKNIDRQRIFDLWVSIYKNFPSDFQNKLTGTLKKDNQSYLGQIREIKKFNPTFEPDLEPTSICLYLLDRLFTGHINQRLASTLYKNFSTDQNCFRDTKKYLEIKIKIRSQKLYRDLGETLAILTREPETNSNSDLLKDLQRIFLDHSGQWEDFFSRVQNIQDFAIIHFGNGKKDQINSLTKLKNSLSRNILIYVQLPVNLAIISLLKNFKLKTLNLIGLKDHSVTTLLEDLFDRSLFFLDFNINKRNRSPLNRLELTRGYFYAVNNKVFEALGTTAYSFLEVLSKNYQLTAHKYLQDDDETTRINFNSSSYKQFEKSCSLIFKNLKKSQSKIPVALTGNLREMTINFLMPQSLTKESPFFFQSRNFPDMVNYINHIYLFNYDIVSLFLKNSDQALSPTERKHIEDIRAERTKVASSYIQTYQKDLISFDQCLWATYSAKWDYFLQALNYEALYLNEIHDQMTQLLENNSNPHSASHPPSPPFSTLPFNKNSPILGTEFKYSKMALFFRLKEYLTQGAYQHPAIAPHLKVSNELTQFTSKEQSENIVFFYRVNKKDFVDEILRTLVIGGINESGLWKFKHLGGGVSNQVHFNSTSIISMNIYKMNNLLKMHYNPLPENFLLEQTLRKWNFLKIRENASSQFPYSESDILNFANLDEKIAIDLYVDGTKNLFVLDKRLQQPFDFILRSLFEEPTNLSSEFIYVNSTASGVAATDANLNATVKEVSIFQKSQDYYRDRNSQVMDIIPVPKSVDDSVDSYYKTLIEGEFQKSHNLLCYLDSVDLDSPNVRSLFLRDPTIQGAYPSKKFPKVASDRLYSKDVRSEYNSRISNFLRQIPYSLEEKTSILPNFNLLKSCNKARNSSND